MGRMLGKRAGQSEVTFQQLEKEGKAAEGGTQNPPFLVISSSSGNSSFIFGEEGMESQSASGCS